jgi:hypothetical protein
MISVKNCYRQMHRLVNYNSIYEEINPHISDFSLISCLQSKKSAF